MKITVETTVAAPIEAVWRAWTDGSFGFDFAGTYIKVVPLELIEMVFGGRTAVVEFIRKDGSIVIRETFDSEETHSIDQQRQGWQAILDRFARYVQARR